MERMCRSAIKSRLCRIPFARCLVQKVVRVFFSLSHFYCIYFVELNLLPATHKSDRLFSPQTMWAFLKMLNASPLFDVSPWNKINCTSSHHVIRNLDARAPWFCYSLPVPQLIVADFCIQWGNERNQIHENKEKVDRLLIGDASKMTFFRMCAVQLSNLVVYFAQIEF